MVEMIKPQGVPCKMLRGNSFETHKINPHDWFHGSIQNIWTIPICKKPLCQNNFEKKPSKSMRTWPTFQKIILYVSISRIMNLNVRHIPGIKDAKNMF